MKNDVVDQQLPEVRGWDRQGMDKEQHDRPQSKGRVECLDYAGG